MSRNQYHKGQSIPVTIPVFDAAGNPFDISGVTDAKFEVTVNKILQDKFSKPSAEGYKEAVAGGQSNEYRLNIQTDESWPQGLIEVKVIASVPDLPNYPSGRLDVGRLIVGELWD